MYNDFWTPQMRAELSRMTLERGGRLAMRDRYDELDPQVQTIFTQQLISGTVPGLAVTGAWVVPVLSAEACDALIERSAEWEWSVNPDEEFDFQIPEAVLSEVDPQLDHEVKSILFEALAPWFVGIWGRLPRGYASVQMTQYDELNTTKGNYHIDQDSDYTAVIALNNDFVGGGTGLVDGVLGEVHLPPVPKGWALVFDGRRVHHKGLPVLEGSRYLLTVWANNDEDLY